MPSIMSEAIQGDAQCQLCKKWISEMEAVKGILIALLLLCAPTLPDEALTPPGGFLYAAQESARVVLRDSACAPLCRRNSDSGGKIYRPKILYSTTFKNLVTCLTCKKLLKKKGSSKKCLNLPTII